MTNSLRTKKNQQISKTKKETMERRKTQRPLTFCCQIRNEKSNVEAKEHFRQVFLECKWIYNSILNQIDKTNENCRKLNSFNQKEFKTVVHLDKDKNEIISEVTHATSSIKNAVIESVKNSLKILKALKKNGNNVGKLKFKSEYGRIVLKQYGITHRIIDKNRIQIQGFKNDIRVAGLQQLFKLEEEGIEFEITSADLIKKDDRYYFNITVYVDKVAYAEYLESKRNYKNNQIGIDFGCSTTLTDSFGEKYDIFVEESERLKRLQKKLKRQKKGSKNRYKTLKQLHKEYKKLTSKKNELANQLYHKLISENEQIIMQDEQIAKWHKNGHGKKVQHSILGRLKQHLVQNTEQVFVMSKWVPTTKLCIYCGHVHKDIKISDREFICPNCGVVYDRDTHAAQNMVWLFNHLNEHIGLDGTDFKRSIFFAELNKLFDSVDSSTSFELTPEDNSNVALIDYEAPGSSTQ